MPVFAVYIEKEVDYFGGSQVMGNTYHYQTDPLEPFNDAGFAAAVADAEKTVTSSQVRFTGWRTWGPTDGPVIDSIIRDSGPLSGTGSQAAQVGMYAEACALFAWPLPRSPVLNRKRWLRKFIRMPGGGGVAWTPAIYAGQAKLTSAQKTAMLNGYGTPVMDPGFFGHQLCTADGVLTNGPAELRDYLYTRQIGQ
jgi:hypothetical protein